MSLARVPPAMARPRPDGRFDRVITPAPSADNEDHRNTLRGLNWDDIRVFIAVARSGRLVGAADRLRLDHTTVSRRITTLEESVSMRLLHRSPSGVKLTPEGLQLLEIAERMEEEAIQFCEAARDRQAGARLRGVVRLATPEAFGLALVAPSIAQFCEGQPEIEVELIPESRNVSLSKGEADLVVSLCKLTNSRLTSRKLADYRLGLYASQDYLARYGAPAGVAELGAHKLVGYIDDLISMPELRYSEEATGKTPVFRSTSANAQQSAVAAGLGIGLLHGFAAERDPCLVPVLPGEVQVWRSYWIATHTHDRIVPRERAVAEFLQELVRDRPDLFRI